MTMSELIRKTRSYRRFKQDPVGMETLRELVDLARTSASGGNVQPLKYVLSADPETNAKVFPTTMWAGHLRPWPGPAEGERPTAYIVILLDKEVSGNAGCDHGIAAQSVVLGAMERGIGACMIGSIKRPELVKSLAIPDRYEVLLIVALGYPGERIILEELTPGGGTKYYRDPNDAHHVPKRRLEDVIVKL
jgi:nitroreductase